MIMILVSQCSLDNKQYCEIQNLNFDIPSKSLISSCWVTLRWHDIDRQNMALHAYALQARQEWQCPHLDSTTLIGKNMALHALQARQQWQRPHLDSTTVHCM